jgi:hypothetical protein
MVISITNWQLSDNFWLNLGIITPSTANLKILHEYLWHKAIALLFAPHLF